MKCIVASSMTLALMFAGLQATAQERQDRLQQTQPRADLAQPGVQGNIESHLAAWLATCNKAEIEVSQLAAQKASDPAVKQFAQQMVEQHNQLNQQLAQFLSPSQRERLIGAAATDRTRAPGQADAPRQTDTARATDSQRRIETAAGQAGQGQDLFQQIGAEAARVSTQKITSLLDQKEGKEFDMCYTGLQVFAHINAASLLEAMQGHGSEQFQQVVMKATQTTNAHLDEAKQLAQKIGESAGSERVTRRPEQPGRQQQERP